MMAFSHLHELFKSLILACVGYLEFLCRRGLWDRIRGDCKRAFLIVGSYPPHPYICPSVFAPSHESYIMSNGNGHRYFVYDLVDLIIEEAFPRGPPTIVMVYGLKVLSLQVAPLLLTLKGVEPVSSMCKCIGYFFPNLKIRELSFQWQLSSQQK